MLESQNHIRPIVGLIPAGGSSERLAPLPCSKEIYPVGFRNSHKRDNRRPKVACDYLLDKMRYAGIERTFIILRNGKWDIPAYFGSGNSTEMNIAYLIRELPYGVPFTLDCAWPYVKKDLVVCGLPDILFQPMNTIQLTVERQAEKGADLVLAVFPVEVPEKWDSIVLDQNNRLIRLVPKPHGQASGYTWVIAVWTPVFGLFMHRYVSDWLNKYHTGDSKTDLNATAEVSLGQVFQAAIDQGVNVDTVIFEEGFCLDIGTPNDLGRAIQTHESFL
jgi:glucose-1-phosphate thymidylyltransferase